MHAGNDDLFNTAVSNATGFIGDVSEGTARHSTAHVWDNAVGTESTASVLHLDKRTRAFASVAHTFAKACVFANRIVLDGFYRKERIGRVGCRCWRGF